MADAPIDKTGWGDGPWQDEPDRKEWMHVDQSGNPTGLRCLLLRNPDTGSLNGYVEIPVQHPLWGVRYQDPELEIDAHGGITYSDVNESIRWAGDEKLSWWIGFDTAHWCDYQPAFNNFKIISGDTSSYKTSAWVENEVNRVADQVFAKGDYKVWTT